MLGLTGAAFWGFSKRWTARRAANTGFSRPRSVPASFALPPTRPCYTALLGGTCSPYCDGARAIALDLAGSAYIAGVAFSSDFPTVNAFQAAKTVSFNYPGTAVAFVAKLNSAGSALVYSTYLGGGVGILPSGMYTSVAPLGLAVDASGSAYMTGAAGAGFPLVNAVQPVFAGGTSKTDAFVAKLNPAGNALVYSTYLGGTGQDEAWGIAVDSAFNAYVTGLTLSADFPTTPGAFQRALGLGRCGSYTECGNAFVAKLSPTGSLVYSTLLGGNGNEYALAVAVDSAGQAYVVGEAEFSADFLVTPGAWQTAVSCAGSSGSCASGANSLYAGMAPQS